MNSVLCGGWALAAQAKGHIDHMERALGLGMKERAEDEFEKAWQLMADARTAFLEEIKAEYESDMAFE